MTNPWPEWLTPENTVIHTALENEMKRALAHCYSSADASGLDWTWEGWISVSASNIMGMLRRAGCPPPNVGEVREIPMPEGYLSDDEEDADLNAEKWRTMAVNALNAGGPYSLTQWTESVQHAAPCDCDEDDETVGERCMANSEWTYAVVVDGGAFSPRLILTLPRTPPEQRDDGESPLVVLGR